MIPWGVHGLIQSCPNQSFATFLCLNPSTSFLGWIAFKMRSWLRCFGSGNCTNIPSTVGSQENSSIHSSSLSSVIFALYVAVMFLIPTALHAFSLLATYTLLAGSSPTRMVTRQGGCLPDST